ncbi:MAG: DnaJ C-terminal domain-containing protein [bacterium]
MNNHYTTLGVDLKASDVEIKKAYRKLISGLHPDRSGKDTSTAFQQVREAYKTLSSPHLKIVYDQVLMQSTQSVKIKPASKKKAPAPKKKKPFVQNQKKQSGTQGSNQTSSKRNSSMFRGAFSQKNSAESAPTGWEQEESKGADFADVFKTVFSRQAKQSTRGRIRGADVRMRVGVSLEKIASGGIQKVRLPKPEHSLTEPGLVEINIPAGCEDGWETVLPGHGHEGRGGGGPGALHIQFYYLKHEQFRVSHKDVFLTVPVYPWEIALGAEITVPTLHGNLKVSIPKGVRSGSQLKLKGQGLPGTPVGDQILLLEITVPDQLSKQEKQLYEKLQALSSEKKRF